MKNLKLFNVSDEYINYLRKYDSKVYDNKEFIIKHGRKYIGIVYKVNNFDYFIPLSSPKKSDYLVEDKIKKIRKNSVPIMRIIHKSKNRITLLGTIRFSNMIPVKPNELIQYKIEEENDKAYKNLVLDELHFILSNQKMIMKNAEKIYTQKIKDINIPYLKNTVDFLLLEEKCKIYKIED